MPCRLQCHRLAKRHANAKLHALFRDKIPQLDPLPVSPNLFPPLLLRLLSKIPLHLIHPPDEKTPLGVKSLP